MITRPKLYRIIGSSIQIAEYESYNQTLDYYVFKYPTIMLDDIRGALYTHNTKFILYDATDKKVQSRQMSGWLPEQQEYLRESPIFEVCVFDESKLRYSKSKKHYICNDLNNIAVYRIIFNGKEYSYFPDSYQDLLKINKNIIDGIKLIFNDYSNPKAGLFFSFHWNRHHTKLADEIRDHLPNDTDEAYQYLLQQRHKLLSTCSDVNIQGSFISRLDFVMGQLAGVIHQENCKEKLKLKA